MSKVRKNTTKKSKRAPPAKLPSTIGENPLDQLIPAAPVKLVARTKRSAPAAPVFDKRTTVLTITVPQALADQVQHMLTMSRELSFDELMTTSLADVLRALKGRARSTKDANGSIKKIAASVFRRKS
ncbi:MAG: hypothetical protein H0V44_15215 [Planctomycetes bacterium]|nr:hypothetical protein [Planctomycetota bacterium]